MRLKIGMDINCRNDYMTLEIAGCGIMWHYHDVSYEKQHYVCTSSIHNEDIPVTEKFCSCLFF
jgi:hypothetical protein